MRLLSRNETGSFNLTKFRNDQIPPYAILSHTWGPDGDEVTFEDMINGTGENKAGYEKIRFCGEQAKQDGLQHFWIDTCCINKSISAELSRSLNSMFHWYRQADKCYVYLSDVSTTKRKRSTSESDWESDFRESRWFTRGWTLQELLAPASVEFFSRERKRLGDKSSLRQQICEISNISHSALEGDPLSQFNFEERMRWVEHRQTKLEEDKAYSLLGIFGVYILPNYGEGRASALSRLEDKFREMQKCFQDLRLTDPALDKKRIEDSKGGLLDGSYQWILETSDYQQWYNDQQSRLLWIKGDPGKGKTMLLCGVINELQKPMAKTVLLSYFFCQATDSRMNSATAVLRGLIYLILVQQPSLMSHIQAKHDQAGKALFEDANAWVALSDIFGEVLQDPNLNDLYIIVDALDECIKDRPKLLDLIIQTSSASPHIKWIVSSRNWPIIEKKLDRATQNRRLCLEVNEKAVSAAIAAFIQSKVEWLANCNSYDDDTRNSVEHHLSSNANGTFLWVALVCQDLADVSGWQAEEMLTAFPPGLDALYERMMNDVCGSKSSKLCTSILAIVSLVYRPITVDELVVLVDMPPRSSGNIKALSEIIGLCGSFLVLRERTISFVHQSAKDYLIEKAHREIFPSGREDIHSDIFSRSLQVMSDTLRQDIYILNHPGTFVNNITPPNPDPLAAVQYSCVYWVKHLHSTSDPVLDNENEYSDNGAIFAFLKRHFLHWLEALSLLSVFSESIGMVEDLLAVVDPARSTELSEFLRDAKRFVLSCYSIADTSPLQLYSSALSFAPKASIIREEFQNAIPKWIEQEPNVDYIWDAIQQTLEGHSGLVRFVAFSYDSKLLASASDDKTIKIWDANTGFLQYTLEGHRRSVGFIAFSYDSKLLASASYDKTTKIWDTNTGSLQYTFEGHSGCIYSVAFSQDSKLLASTSEDKTIKIWEANTGSLQQTLESYSDQVYSIAFSYDSQLLKSASKNGTIKIWDAHTGALQQTFECLGSMVKCIAFSYDSKLLALRSQDETIKIWNTSTGSLQQTLAGHSDSPIYNVTFSHDSKLLASSDARFIKIWDVNSGSLQQTLECDRDLITSIAFSHDSKLLALAFFNTTIRILDASTRSLQQTKISNAVTGPLQQTFEGHSGPVTSVAFSHDSKLLASASLDAEIKIWDASNGFLEQTLEGHNDQVNSVVFSHDSKLLASASQDETIKIWNASTRYVQQTLEGHGGSVTSVAFSHNSRLLVSASLDETIKIWDTSTGALQRTLKSHSSDFHSIAFSYDLKLLALASQNKTIKIWNASTGSLQQTLEGHSDQVTSVAFSHDSKLLASVSYETIKIWDTSTGSLQQMLEGYYSSVYSIAFSHDSKLLASASEDGTVNMWDASTGSLQQTLKGYWVHAVVFSYDSKLLALASKDKTIKIWDANTNSLKHTLTGHYESITSIAYSYDSKLLVSASIDKTINIWNASTGSLQQTLEGHSDQVYSIVFSHNSKLLAIASEDGTINIWNVKTGSLHQTLKGSGNQINSIAFSYDSKLLVITSEDKTITIWNASTNSLQRTLKGHSDQVYSIGFSQDSKLIASASNAKTVKIWDASTGTLQQSVEVESHISSLSFDPTSSSLITDRGHIRVDRDGQNTSSASFRDGSSDRNREGLGINGSWITWNAQNLLWMPPDFRASTYDISPSMSTVAKGCSSGRVFVIRFSLVILMACFGHSQT